MVQCFVPDCNHQSERETCKFFRFPNGNEQRKHWEKLIRRADRISNQYSKVCSCHFKDGIKENGPTIFARNEKKIFNFPSPEKRKRKQREPLITGNEEILHTEIPIESEMPSTSQFSKECEVSSRTCKISILQAEIEVLNKEIEKLKIECEYLTDRFCMERIKHKPELILLYTGLPNIDIFNLLLEFCERFERSYYYGWKVQSLKAEDQLLMTLMKLRRNEAHEDLAFRFNCSRHTVSNIILTWIHLLHELLFQALMKTVPSRIKNQSCLPNCFINFVNCRMTIDCTEIKCAVPYDMDTSNLTYSYYKHSNTFKGLVGVALNGCITFMSELYPGSVSDKEIVKDCKILDVFKPGDLILADKSFTIRDVLPPGVMLNIPPFLTAPQFTPQQVIETKSIAKARIHVERAIKRIKGYCILDYVHEQMRGISTILWQVCGALTNLQFPLLREVECFFKPSKF